MDQNEKTKGYFLSGLLWISLLGGLLFWIPVAGPLFAGFTGGMRSGRRSTALTAVLLPLVILTSLLGISAASLNRVPILGAYAPFGGLTLIGLDSAPLLLGAFLGGWMA